MFASLGGINTTDRNDLAVQNSEALTKEIFNTLAQKIEKFILTKKPDHLN